MGGIILYYKCFTSPSAGREMNADPIKNRNAERKCEKTVMGLSLIRARRKRQAKTKKKKEMNDEELREVRETPLLKPIYF